MAVILVNIEDTFNQWRKKTNSISLGVGDFRYIESGDTTVIRATNRNYKNIGTPSALSTIQKGNLVDAINEVDYNTDINSIKIGNISNLQTDDKSSLVNAINELDDDIGNLNFLSTDGRTSLVVAISEVDDHTDINTANIGNMGNMPDIETGTPPSTIINALIETDSVMESMMALINTNIDDIDNLENDVDNLWSKVGTASLNTNAYNLSDAINELFATSSLIGDLSDLTTEEQGTIVGAINEISAVTILTNSQIGDMATLETADRSSLVGAINEMSGNAIALALVLG